MAKRIKYEGEIDRKPNEDLAPVFRANFQPREISISWQPGNLITKLLRKFLNVRLTYCIAGIVDEEQVKEPMLTEEEIKEEQELADMGLGDYLASIERDEK